jgi:hypothetical protein
MVLSYTEQLARTNFAQHEGNNSMLTTRISREHPMKWQPSAAMYVVVCSLGLTMSAINKFGGRLGQEASIDIRKTKY